jgi:aspartate aminotransferase
MLAARIAQVQTSATLKISAMARALRAEGKPIIDLSLGELDLPPPPQVEPAVIAAMRAGHTRYTAAEGILALRQAVTKKLAEENQLNYHAKDIIISTGAKQSIFNACQAILNPGDQAIIPLPCWGSYIEMVALAGGIPVKIAPQQHNFKLCCNQLKAALNQHSKLFILNSPSNPSGVMYNAAELQAIAEILTAYPHVYILSDDIYEHITWQNTAVHLLTVAPHLSNRTIIINGVSKAYAMTGWRVGYAASHDQALIQAMQTIQSQSTSNTCSIAQYAALAALESGTAYPKQLSQIVQERYNYLHTALTNAGIECQTTDGSFYLFPKINFAKTELHNDIELAAVLLQKAGLAVVPGSSFGMPGYLRLSLSCDLKNLQTAAEILPKFI